MSSPLDQGAQAAANERNFTPSAVAYQFLIMAGASLVTIIGFNIIRPMHKRIYQPKVKYHVGDKEPPKISSSFCGWISPVVRTREAELLDKIGLDGVTFLRFMGLLRVLFTGTAIIACGILIPIDIIYNRAGVPDWKRDLLSMSTIRDVKGHSLYAHIAVTYMITFLVVGLVYIYWRDMLKLRNQWFRSPEHMNAFYARTLCITHVPGSLQSDAGISKVLDSVKMPYPATAVHIGRQVGRLPELIEYHNNTVRELEVVLVKHLKGGKVAAKRPTVRLGGCCGFGGVEKDAIEFYTAKLKRTEAAVNNYRNQMDSRKAERYGFASLAAVHYAHIAARKLAGKSPKGTNITLSPNPKDIIWENMNMTSGALSRRKLLGFFYLGVICFLSLIPMFLLSALANLDAVAAFAYLPWLQKWAKNSETSFAMCRIMRWLSQYMGGLTHARLDRAVVARFFAFNVITQLIIFTLIGVVFNAAAQVVALINRKESFKNIIANFDQLPETINETYINQSSYWLQYFAFRFFATLLFDLGQAMFGRTPRDIKDWTQPAPFEYALIYANMLFLVAVAFLFAPLAPLVALVAAIVFWLNSWVFKYNLMYVFVTKVETGGRLWNVVINRLLFCVMLMQALMVLTIGLQDRFKSFLWISTIPPILIIIVFKWFITRKFIRSFSYYIPTQDELRTAKVHSGRGDVKGHRLENRFGHPALHAELFTPMLHADMLPLLRGVYGGAVTEDKTTTKLKEYGGQRVDAQVIDGLKIAAVAQKDLEYDPGLYQRNYANTLEWDGRSMTTSTVFGTSAYTPSIMSSPLLAPTNNSTSYFDQRPQHMSMYSTSQVVMEQPRFGPIQEDVHGNYSHQQTPSFATQHTRTSTLVPPYVQRTGSPMPYTHDDQHGSPTFNPYLMN
ncbi:hypothetical protein CPB85DRAFT_1310572 [Mucidula mucida]|nr:hypothetical protein CPB85DRAFT_1310572 [Mucidula mucida]